MSPNFVNPENISDMTLSAPYLPPAKLRTLTGHRSAIYDLVAGENSSIFYSLGGDGCIVRWDASSQSADGVLIAQADAQLFSGHVLGETQELVAGDMNGHLYWMDLRTRNILHRFTAHSKSIYSVAQAGDEFFVTAAGDGCIGIWDIRKRSLLMKLQLSQQGLRSMALHEDVLYVGGSDNCIHRVFLPEWKVLEAIPNAHDNSVFSLLATEEGLLSGGRDAHLKCRHWNHIHTVHKDVPAHWFTINKILSLNTMDLIATASRDKTIRLWKTSCDPVMTMDMKMTGHTHSINTLLWLPERQKLFSAGDDRTIREFVWG